ncbi:MAG: hypothetical protein MZV63_04005 [Marinilabiliales bacterium]|nr:hypothetical protein [Marinilabiliales bacterium]
MRRNRTITLKEALEELIKEYRLAPKLKEASVINIWERCHRQSNFRSYKEDIYH